MLRFRIKELAEERGLNRSQLQIKSGLSLGLIYRYWNNDTTQATFEALEKIARALGVSPLDLLTAEENKEDKHAAKYGDPTVLLSLDIQQQDETAMQQGRQRRQVPLAKAEGLVPNSEESKR